MEFVAPPHVLAKTKEGTIRSAFVKDPDGIIIQFGRNGPGSGVDARFPLPLGEGQGEGSLSPNARPLSAAAEPVWSGWLWPEWPSLQPRSHD